MYKGSFSQTRSLAKVMWSEPVLNCGCKKALLLVGWVCDDSGKSLFTLDSVRNTGVC